MGSNSLFFTLKGNLSGESSWILMCFFRIFKKIRKKLCIILMLGMAKHFTMYRWPLENHGVVYVDHSLLASVLEVGVQ